MDSTASYLKYPAALAAAGLGIALLTATQAAQATTLIFDTEFIELNLSGTGVVPLAADPGNQLGDSVNGYGFVESQFTITLSSQRGGSNPGPLSLGQTIAHQGSPINDALAINPADLDGETFVVDSFFDVFFDITVTDVDNRPGRDYAGQPNGASLFLQDNGPARLASSYNAVFDASAPNFGLLPPPGADPYTGFDAVEIPLGGDINGNGEADKIKIVLATLSLSDQNRSFIELPDGSVINQFDIAAMLEGAVVDESTDPPFMIGMALSGGLPDPNGFAGPGIMSSDLQNAVVPLPAAVWLFGTALIGFVGISRRRKLA